MPPKRCVILVGHGGIPKDCPPELVTEFKRQEKLSGGKPTPALLAADKKLRDWPRTPESDPYKPGLEAVAKALGKALPDRLILEAYNEFCPPSLEEAFEMAVNRSVTDITVITTMYTRGGIHSETEIPAIVERIKAAHPGISVRYCWPFSPAAVASFLAGEIARAEAVPHA